MPDSTPDNPARKQAEPDLVRMADPPMPDPLLSDSWPAPPATVAMARGLSNRCPVCGRTKLFRGWLKVEDECAACRTQLGLVRADDAPPYFVILITGHVVVALMVWVERTWSPPAWLQAAIFLPLTLVLVLALLRPVKGATVGLMLRLGLVRDADSDDPLP